MEEVTNEELVVNQNNQAPAEEAPLTENYVEQPVQQFYWDPVEDAKGETYDFIERVNDGSARMGLSDDAQSQVAAYLKRAKKNYNIAKRRAENLPSSSDAYQKEVDKLNAIQSRVTNLVDQVNGFKKGQEEFLKDFDSGAISESVYRDENGIDLNRMYSNKMQLIVSEDGDLKFGDGITFKPYSRISKYDVKDYQTADQILKLNKEMYDQKQEMTEQQSLMVRSRLNDIVIKNGRSSVISMIYDGLVPGIDKDSFDPVLFEPRNYKYLREEFLNRMMVGMQGTAASGYQAAIDKKKEFYSLGEQHKRVMESIETAGYEDRAQIRAKYGLGKRIEPKPTDKKNPSETSNGGFTQSSEEFDTLMK